ncbi:MAG: S8 family serine peptidase [Rhodospirillales bacterium]|nr:S8 family serine peptidase [Rhodospirillales bacterium]MDH3791668.1 S8 family serine peptidase [Rhodospirillales bacterium]MDH3914286.1 S8 family serine peptidase [Rhodospirillales bacterium]MDH3918450.1 S8 family serine peptidase [Rhodospirillales bacterium]MDH3967453.1 S8 family serine peptidase [Rhodospirillales bacterium]
MRPPVLVGLLDSGVAPDLAPAVEDARSFTLGEAGRVTAGPVEPDRLGHGSTLAWIIAGAAPEARLLDAQVFLASHATSPAVVAAGLDWLAGRGARIVNMSFGLRHDREVLRRACDSAREAGVILLASAPARGAMVYPAGYQGVVKVSGDARCAPGEISTLGGAQADFGAHPRPLAGAPGAGQSGGASFAVAHLCGHLAGYLAERPGAGRDEMLEHLAAVARYHGPERRRAGTGD